MQRRRTMGLEELKKKMAKMEEMALKGMMTELALRGKITEMALRGSMTEMDCEQ